jgi:hypothetical protein
MLLTKFSIHVGSVLKSYLKLKQIMSLRQFCHCPHLENYKDIENPFNHFEIPLFIHFQFAFITTLFFVKFIPVLCFFKL